MSFAANSPVVGRICEIDGLRGIAIGLVVLYHAIVAPAAKAAPGSIGYFFARTGMLSWSGVDLFFVLSGFLVGGILLDVRDSRSYFRTFYVRRAVRILPLYIVLSTVPFIVEWLAPSVAQLLSARFGEPFPWYISALFAQNIWIVHIGTWKFFYLVATWSLAIEEQFYLTFPLIVRNTSTRALQIICIATIVAVPFMRVLAGHFIGPLAPYVLIICRADALMCGVLSAILVRHKPAGQVFGARTRRLTISTALFLAAILVIFTQQRWTLGTRPMNAFGYTVLAAFYSCLILIALDERNRLYRTLLRNRLLVTLGTVSYCVYLIHQVVLSTIDSFTARYLARLEYVQILRLPLALTLILAIAGLSWRFFEKPLIALGHRFSYGTKQNPGVRAAIETSTPQEAQL